MPPDWGWVWVKWWYKPACSRNQTVADCVCVIAVLLKDKELSRQLTSGICICELACMLNTSKNGLSKFYYDVSNWPKERTWNFNGVITAHAVCVTFNHLRFSRWCNNIFKVCWNFYTVSVWNFILFLAAKEFWRSIKISQSWWVA